MPPAKARTTRRARSARGPAAQAERVASYQRRIRAASLVRGDDDPVPDDIDEFRLNLARRIAMLINDWRGCPEPLCPRHRGCMAPYIACSNARPRPPVSDEQFARFKADFQRTLRAVIDRRAAEDM
jgi:hypothetical protein